MLEQSTCLAIKTQKSIRSCVFCVLAGHEHKERYREDVRETTIDFVHPGIGVGTTAIACEAARARMAREAVNFMVEKVGLGLEVEVEVEVGRKSEMKVCVFWKGSKMSEEERGQTVTIYI